MVAVVILRNNSHLSVHLRPLRRRDPLQNTAFRIFGNLKHRKLILINPSERIRKLLAVAQLDTLFPTYEDVESAVAAEK